MLSDLQNNLTIVLPSCSLGGGGKVNHKRVFDCRNVSLKVDVDDRTDDLHYFSFVHNVPEIISDTSRVIAACRALLNCNVSSSCISAALSDADFIATMRALCSLACDSSRAWYTITDASIGRTVSTTSSPEGSIV